MTTLHSRGQFLCLHQRIKYQKSLFYLIMWIPVLSTQWNNIFSVYFPKDSSGAHWYNFVLEMIKKADGELGTIDWPPGQTRFYLTNLFALLSKYKQTAFSLYFIQKTYIWKALGVQDNTCKTAWLMIIMCLLVSQPSCSFVGWEFGNSSSRKINYQSILAVNHLLSIRCSLI